jgi:L-alanine-DL-glutamate epimerase-like enolase superfamily enzyme
MSDKSVPVQDGDYRTSLIERVQARTVVVPLPTKTSFARRDVSERHYTLVRIEAAQGVVGIGFCYSGNAGGSVVTAGVRSLLAPALVGQDAWRVRGIWDDLYHHILLLGRAGALMRALSAVDIALWDLNARTLGIPLWQLLGGVNTSRVPAYASGGYYIDGKRPEDLATEMRTYVDAGFSAVKMKVGRASAGADADRVAAVRDAVGPDVLVMLDANNAWRDLPTAVHHVRSLQPYDPYWIEEPFSPDDIANHRRLADVTGVIVASGEIEAGRWRHKALLDAGAVGVLQPDAAVCGGISEFQRIAALADAYGCPVAPHWFHDLHVHLVASTTNATFVEFFPDDSVFNFSALVDTRLAVADGHLVLPTGPGLGFQFDPNAIDRYAVDGWS